MKKAIVTLLMGMLLASLATACNPSADNTTGASEQPSTNSPPTNSLNTH